MYVWVGRNGELLEIYMRKIQQAMSPSFMLPPYAGKETTVGELLLILYKDLLLAEMSADAGRHTYLVLDDKRHFT